MRKNLLPISITNFLENVRKNLANEELKKGISVLLDKLYFIWIYLFIVAAFLKLFILLKEPDYESVISFGEKGTILIATLALLTFSYASVLDYPEKKAIRKSGKYFLNSVLNFVIGLIFSIGFREALTEPSSNTFGLPDFVIVIPLIIAMFALFFIGLGMLILSAFYLTKGITGLIKSLKNETFDKVVE
ncbi:MAG: hypothetical protein OIN89_05785 [Candidatus Methanoperedens sp.]|jgi:hypothetical protein|nr:hypothetical protein [Candidatus Methanoperedens sp.]